MTEDPLESHRPAIAKVVLDLEDVERELLRGFDSRREVLEWSRQTTVRALGELPQRWYLELARQFRGSPRDGERALMSALLVGRSRSRDLSDTAARGMRERIAADMIRPAMHRAVRQIRPDAGEYVDDSRGGESAHDPRVQRYVAMRPALEELSDYQDRALSNLLEGFDDEDDILSWTSGIELATHGEVREDIPRRVITEQSTRRMLLDDSDSSDRARELFGARYLIPAFNRGVRDLRGRSIESPQNDTDTDDAPLA